MGTEQRNICDIQLISLQAACDLIGGNPRLLAKLAERKGAKVHRNGRFRYISSNDLDSLGRGVRDWLDRPRLSHGQECRSKIGELRQPYTFDRQASVPD
jgi:hypothetical protein